MTNELFYKLVNHLDEHLLRKKMLVLYARVQLSLLLGPLQELEEPCVTFHLHFILAICLLVEAAVLAIEVTFPKVVSKVSSESVSGVVPVAAIQNRLYLYHLLNE